MLPNPSPLVESWGPNAQEFVAITPKEVKRSTRTKRKKFDGENERQDGEGTPKRRYTKNPNKKRKSLRLLNIAFFATVLNSVKR